MHHPRGAPNFRGAALLLGAGAVAAAGLVARERTVDGAVRPPNVVLVVVDTLRADALTDPGGRVATPALDAFAADGAVFLRAFSHAPMTLPSHTALFSSRFPHESGVKVNGQQVPADLPLLAAHLAERGYATSAVVSLTTLQRSADDGLSLERSFGRYEKAEGHVSPAEEVLESLRAELARLPDDRPFFLFAHFADPHEPYDAHGTIERVADLSLNGKPLERVATSDSTAWGETVSLAPGENVFELRSGDPLSLRLFQCWIGGSPVEPRFLEGALRAPGSVVRIALDNPGDAPAEAYVSLWVADVVPDSELVARYAREVEHADRHVGQLFADLKARGLYDDALIVFTSDHGESLGERGAVGHAYSLVDHLLHVPLVVKPPRGSPALAELRARGGELVSHVDVVPTALELLGLPPLPGQRGRSLLSAAPPRPHFAETHRPEANHDLLGLRDERWKLVYVADEERFQLFDLERDPRELRDVFAQHGARFGPWQEELRAAAERSLDSELDMTAIDAATLEHMRAIGYFGD